MFQWTGRTFVGRLLAFTVLTLLLSGCGGGGAAYPLNTQTRLLAAGDQWTYRGTSKSDTTRTFHFTVMLKAATLNGASVLEEVLIYSDPSATDRYRLLTQDPVTRNVTYVGYQDPDGSTQTLKTPLLIMPGNWSAVSALPGGPDMRNGAVTITGHERVSAPLGAFMAYKTLQPYSSPNEGGEITRWYAPELGTYVLEEAHSFCTVCDVKNYSSTIELEATNVPLTHP